MADFWLIEVECKWLLELLELLDGSFLFPMPVQFRMWGCACLWRYYCPRVLVCCVSTPLVWRVLCVCRTVSCGSRLVSRFRIHWKSEVFLFSFGFFIYLFIFFVGKRQEKVVGMVVRYWLLVTTSASRGKPIKSKDPPLNIKEKIFFPEKKGKKNISVLSRRVSDCIITWFRISPATW